MSDSEYFSIIDKGIDRFNADKGFNVSKKPHSDWLLFDWRQITWKQKGLEYLIEIYPQFDKNEHIESWELYTAVSYDSPTSRFYLSKGISPKTELSLIVADIDKLLTHAYDYILTIKKENIPLIVNFSS